MRALVLLGGEVASYLPLRAAVQECGLVIAADGGARHLAPLGVHADLLAGDFDSIDAALLRRMQEAGVRTERFPVEKDATDSEIVFRSAREAGAQEILAVGALGSRPDHVLANQMMAARYSAEGVRVWLVDGRSLMTPLCGGTVTGRLEGRDVDRILGPSTSGLAVSLIALTTEVGPVRTDGLHYPLEGAWLAIGSTLGVSNLLSGGWDGFSVSCTSGTLLVVVTPAV